jgi:hypothetical protein
VTFTNLTNGPIYVTSLVVALTNAFQAGCSASEFQVSDKTLSGTPPATTITFSPAQTVLPGTPWTYNGTLALPDDHTNQNPCAGQGLSISYTGSANYTLLTTTTLTSTQNSSTDSATLTATVAPDIQPASAGHAPGAGEGSVTFYQCSNNTGASSCTTTLGTSSLSGGVATLTIPASTVGSYNLEAVFAPVDATSFVTSTSPIITRTLSGCVITQTAGASTIYRTGTTYNGNYEVTNGQSLWLDGGTINGNVTVDGGGQFAATGGTITGNIQSTGGPAAMSGTTVKGNVQTQNGGLALGPGTSIGGNAQAQGGGPFCSDGTPANGSLPAVPVQVKLNLQGQGLTSTSTSSVCATTVGNNLQWLSNGSPSVLGTCGANKILGNLIVQYNTGNITVGASGTTNGNATSGNIIVQSNTGGGMLCDHAAGRRRGAGVLHIDRDKQRKRRRGNSERSRKPLRKHVRQEHTRDVDGVDDRNGRRHELRRRAVRQH